jgi:outer membrane protein assembly factor BamB
LAPARGLVSTSDAQVLALSIEDGSIVWRTQVSSEVLAVPRIDLGVVVIQTVDGAITGLSGEDGHQLWVSDHSVPVLTLRGTSTPAVERGIVVSGFPSGKVVALTTEKGLQVWETNIAIPQGRSELERLVDVDADPVIVGTTVYVVSYQGKIAIIDYKTGISAGPATCRLCRSGVDFAQVYVMDSRSELGDTGASVWKQDKLHNRALTAPEPFGSYGGRDFEVPAPAVTPRQHIAGRSRWTEKGIAASSP